MDMNSGSNQIQLFRAAGNARSGFRCSVMLALGTSIMLTIVGCRSSQSSIDDMFFSAALPPKAAMMDYSTNALHEGDIVGITFQYSTNFNAVQKIGLDGMLNLDTVGLVKAAGLTLMDLQQELATKYKPLVKDDVITVKLISSMTSVYVSGAVLRPGTVEMDRPLTVMEAVMGAGGFDTTRAKLSAVIVLRIVNGEQQTHHVNLKRLLDGKETSPFYLQPFDIIYVPAKTFNY